MADVNKHIILGFLRTVLALCMCTMNECVDVRFIYACLCYFLLSNLQRP
jgi:hypothetical protein